MIPSILSRRGIVAAALGAAFTITAAGAASVHRFTSQTSGSLGAAGFLQTNAAGGALQGEVASSSNTSIKLPFGVLGEYNAPGSTFGVGVAGISTNGYAVAGESLSDSEPSVLGYAGATGGAANNGNVGVEGVAPANTVAAGVYGASAGFGAGGSFAATGNGYGLSAVASGSAHSSQAAIFAENDSTAEPTAYLENVSFASPPPALNAGSTVYATGAGPAVVGRSFNDPGFVSEMYCDSNEVSSNSDGIEGQVCAAYYAVQSGTSGGYAFLDYNATSGQYPFYVDVNGDVVARGTVVGADAVSRNPGTDEMTYGAKQTEKTVEDFGRAKLIAGTADVPLRADYLATIDSATPYMVFLTPHGDNRGLYVTSMTAHGFVVRESQGGRSNLDFDYRIVASPAGTIARRLPRESTVIAKPALPARGRTVDAVTARANAVAQAEATARRHPYVEPAPALVPRP